MALGKSALVVCLIVPVAALAQDPAAHEFFEKKIRPVLVKVPGMPQPQGQDRRPRPHPRPRAILHGGQSGPIRLEGQSREAARCCKVLSYDERLKMPPTGKLKRRGTRRPYDLGQGGRAWPGAAPRPRRSAAVASAIHRTRKEFWAFQPFGRSRRPW